MQANSPGAFFVSTVLHGIIAIVIVVVGFMVQQRVEKAPKIFELVAGEGDNYMANVAAALGTEGGVKFAPPVAPVAKPLPPEPTPVQAAPEPVVERAPVTPAPKATPVKPAPADEIRDFSKDVKRISSKRQKRLEDQDRKLREIAERKAKAAEVKRMTKEEFDRQNKTKVASTKAGVSPKISKIDAEGIAKGVLGGSTANKIGGAGGKALIREQGEALDLYFSYLKRRLKEELDKPPGLSDSLVAIVEVRIAANGLLSGAKISRSSGSEDFDHAALASIARVKSIGPRPDGKSEVLTIPFRMREEDEG